MSRMWAIVERELRRFRRSPILIVVSMIFPLCQLVILGYAFGGNVKHLKVAVVDQDHGLPAVKIRELAQAASSGARTIDLIDYADEGQAVVDLRNGRVNGVLTIPPEFSRRVLVKNQPRIALIEDNTDTVVANALAGNMTSMLLAYNEPPTAARVPAKATLDVVEVYPYVPYIQYLLPGSIAMSIFMMVMIGGGIIFIDDKARGLHEGYLVTPISKLELIAGFNISGTIKAVLAGFVIMLIGSGIAGVPNPFDPPRILRLFVLIVLTAFALISMMFLLMVRDNDPLIPPANYCLLNTGLYFPSGPGGPARRRRAALRRSRLREGHGARHLQEGPRKRRRRELSLRGQGRPVRRGHADGDRDDAGNDGRGACRRARPATARTNPRVRVRLRRSTARHPPRNLDSPADAARNVRSLTRAADGGRGRAETAHGVSVPHDRRTDWLRTGRSAGHAMRAQRHVSVQQHALVAGGRTAGECLRCGPRPH